jgi:hypothetical protein
MGLRDVLRGVGVVGAVIGLGAGLAVNVGGCAGDAKRADAQTPALGAQASAPPRLPSLDLEAPSEYQTASFAFG